MMAGKASLLERLESARGLLLDPTAKNLEGVAAELEGAIEELRRAEEGLRKGDPKEALARQMESAAEVGQQIRQLLDQAGRLRLGWLRMLVEGQSYTREGATAPLPITGSLAVRG